MSDLSSLRAQLVGALNTQYKAQVQYTDAQASMYAAQESLNAKQQALNNARSPLLSTQRSVNQRKIALDKASYQVNSIRAQIQILTNS